MEKEMESKEYLEYCRKLKIWEKQGNYGIFFENKKVKENMEIKK